MTVERIKISKFGKLSNLEISFSDNVNIIYGSNESGKSTVIAFIKACLYGLSAKGNDNARKRYTPWDLTDTFGGEMYFTHGGSRYRYVCRFGKTKRSDTSALYNNITGEQVRIPANMFLGEFLFNLSEGAFDSSIYAAQLQSKIDTTKDKSGQIMSKLAVYTGSDTSSVNIAEKRLKSYMDKIKAPRSQNGILDKLYITKKETEAALYEIINNEDKIKTLKEEYEKLVLEKNRTETAIKVYEAKETLKNRTFIMEKMSHIDRLQESINNEGTKGKKNHKKTFLISSILLAIVAVILYFSSLSPYFALIPLAFGIISLFIAVKSSNKTDNISLTLKELEKEEAILDHILGKKSLSEYEKEWKNAETFLSQISQNINTDNIESQKARLEQLNTEITYKKALIEASNTNDNYTELLDNLHRTKKEIKNYEEKYNAVQIAHETLKKAFGEFETTFSPAISDKIGEILKALTDNEHSSIRLSKELEITISEDDGFHTADAYSGGTVDQIYLAFRLAISKLISREETLPVFLDEPFVQYDNERLNNSLNYLRDYSRQNRCQIILTSCQERIVSKDFERYVNFVRI